jgi:hypothetical protein
VSNFTVAGTPELVAAEQRQIEWRSAEIEDGALTVRLAGASSKAWKARFKGVLALLDTPHSGWGEVRLVKKSIKVARVQQGSEADLRHFLESAVLQANTDAAPDGTPPEPHEDDDEETDVDRQMTQTFRGFAT